MTDKEIGYILDNLTIIVDTRERKNEHIIQWFTDNGIKYINQKLDFGDYSVKIPEEYGTGFENIVSIEKKNSLDEICGNFTKGRDRFIREFERAENSKFHLVIENATWKKLWNESYRSQLPANSLCANIMTFSIRYGVPVWFVEKSEIGRLIYKLIYYEVREFFKNYT